MFLVQKRSCQLLFDIDHCNAQQVSHFWKSASPKNRLSRIHRIMKQAHQLKTNMKIKAYFAAGSLEYDAHGGMVDNLKLFYSDLPKSKNFESKFEIINDENHASMLPAGLTKGFKFIFGK